MNYYNVKINTPNILFYVKNKKVRTPIEIIKLSYKELKNIKIKMKQIGIMDYVISDYDNYELVINKNNKNNFNIGEEIIVDDEIL